MAGWKSVWKKVEATEAQKVKKCAIAFSGGLDSALGVELLRRKYKAKQIVAINIDVGQGDDEQAEMMEKAKALKVKPSSSMPRRNSPRNGFPWPSGRTAITTAIPAPPP